MEVDSVHKDAPTGITGFKRMTRYYNYSLAAFGPHTHNTRGEVGVSVSCQRMVGWADCVLAVSVVLVSR